MQKTEGLTVEIGADIAPLKAGLLEATRLGQNFGSSLSTAFEDVALRGKTLSEAFSSMALSLARSSLRSAVKPIGSALTGELSGLFSSGMSAFTSASPTITPFAKGGVFDHPTMTSLNGPRLGVIGEAGPEAVLPLTRGSDGRLGVRNEGGGGAPVTVNISTPDAASFAKAESQVAATVARAIERGRRNL